MALNLLVHTLSFANCGTSPMRAANNVSMEWLVTHPHVFLWADNIFISNESYETIADDFKDTVRRESVQLVLDEFKKERVIQTFNPQSIAKPPLSDLIWNQVDEDSKRWSVEGDIKNLSHGICSDREGDEIKDHCTIDISGLRICPNMLASVYFTLAFCRILDSGCLLDPHYSYICDKRFHEITPQYTNPFSNIFNMLVPSVQVLGDYVFSEWREKHSSTGEERSCALCKNKARCKSECLDKTESSVGQIIDFRKRNEMTETKKVIIKAIDKVRENGSEDAVDILNELNHEAKRCKERMLYSFPKIQRWVKVSAFVSTPIAFLGMYYNDSIINSMSMTGNLTPAMTAAGASALTHMADKYLDIMKSKYSWVNFLDELKQSSR